MNPRAAEVLSKKRIFLDFLLKRIAKNINKLANPRGKSSKLLKYQWLPSLFAAILKVRKWDKSFMRDQHDIDLWVTRIERLNPAIDEFILLQGYPVKIADILHESYAAIIDYIKGCGNDIPLLSEDIGKDK